MIEYTEGYKYQLTKEHRFNIERVNDNRYPPNHKDYNELWYWEASPFLRLYPDGTVVQSIGYAWDGCSGPAIDDDTNQVPGLEHDGEYQLIRAGILPEKPWRKRFDKWLRSGVLKRGMNWFRAWYYYRGVRFGGYDAATKKREILTAE